MSKVFNMMNIKKRPEMLKDLVRKVSEKVGGRKLAMVEIGSYAGQSMEAFAGSGFVSSIACVDPWKAGYDAGDPASKTDMKEVERLFDGRAEKARAGGVEVLKHKGTVDTFTQSSEFGEMAGKIDFVYVDGMHTYDAVKHDIRTCLDVIRPLVAVCGHDYVLKWCPGVVRVVDELFGKPDATFDDGSWIKFVQA